MLVVDDSRIVEVLKALADPIRLAIIRELQGGTRCACQLSEVAETTPSLLSYHLGILRDAGLVTSAKRGRWVDYTLDTVVFDDLVGGLVRRPHTPELVAP